MDELVIPTKLRRIAPAARPTDGSPASLSRASSRSLLQISRPAKPKPWAMENLILLAMRLLQGSLPWARRLQQGLPWGRRSL